MGQKCRQLRRSVPVHLRSAGWAPGGFCFSMDFSRFHQNITGHFCIHIISYSPAYSSWMFTNVHDVGLAIAGQSWDVYPMLSFVSRVTEPAWLFFMQIAWMRQREVGLEAQREAQFEARQILVTGSRHRDSVTELPTPKKASSWVCPIKRQWILTFEVLLAGSIVWIRRALDAHLLERYYPTVFGCMHEHCKQCRYVDVIGPQCGVLLFSGEAWSLHIGCDMPRILELYHSKVQGSEREYIYI